MLELFVDFDLISGDKLVGFVGHPDDCLELVKHGVGHTFLACRRSVRSDAILALVGDTDGNVKHLLGERIERPGRHDLFDALPGALQSGGIVSDGLPEIVDPIRLASGHDVVINAADFRARVLIFDQSEGCHDLLPDVAGG